jgi:hypothetical protein
MLPLVAEAQQARGWIASTAQVVGMRPVARSADPCVDDGGCYVALDPVWSSVASQELHLTAWGFGVQGLSGTVHLRTRQDLGGSFPWPRSNDPFDAMLAFGELVRGPWTLRLGRQEIRSGLGFPSFDGASVRWASRAVRAEAYGGRSLARGLRDPVDDALRGLEDFLPDQGVDLVGVAVTGRVGSGAATARYHREILADRSGLASERASLDASWTSSLGSIRGAVDWDVARRAVGKGHLTLSRPFDGARGWLELTASRYVPYFSMSTIWGLFEPVAYSEGTARVGWAPRDGWAGRVSVGLRSYGDAGTAVVLRPLEDVGRRAGLDVTWSPTEGDWSAGATYDLEWGPGGYLGSLSGRVRWSPDPHFFVAASGRTLQQIEQYRLGDGRAIGGGLSAGAEIGRRLDLSGGFSLLRHRNDGGGEASPWNQTRGWTTLRVALGGDPGRASGGSERR